MQTNAHKSFKVFSKRFIQCSSSVNIYLFKSYLILHMKFANVIVPEEEKMPHTRATESLDMCG